MISLSFVIHNAGGKFLLSNAVKKLLQDTHILNFGLIPY